jgi:hypothetical protein
MVEVQLYVVLVALSRHEGERKQLGVLRLIEFAVQVHDVLHERVVKLLGKPSPCRAGALA